jgi:hypothetical protein
MSSLVKLQVRGGLFVVAIFAGTILTVGCSNSASKTTLRFVNTSPNVASVNAVVDGVALGSGIADLGGATAYLTATSGSRHIQIEDAGNSAVDIDETRTLAAGSTTTYVIAGDGPALTPVALTDDNSAPASGSFKLRVVNATPSLGSLDVYVVPTGTDITTVSATFSGLSFPSASSTYSSNTAGSYQVLFTTPTFKTVIFGTASMSFSAGQVRTLLGVQDQLGNYSTVVLSDAN